jgi:mannose-6-phosphate isomerase-like protein (cupin superfamily)
MEKAMLVEFANLHEETRKRWDDNQFLEYDQQPYSEESSYLGSLTKVTPWVPYENYMFARLIATTPGQVGLLHIRFPPEIAEDSRLHIHHHSDRLITVVKGSGEFLISQPGGDLACIHLEKGMRLWMPRGIRHTFFAGKIGLTLESIHNPFIALDDPKILEYDDQMGYLVRLNDGKFEERQIAV